MLRVLEEPMRFSNTLSIRSVVRSVAALGCSYFINRSIFLSKNESSHRKYSSNFAFFEYVLYRCVCVLHNTLRSWVLRVLTLARRERRNTVGRVM